MGFTAWLKEVTGERKEYVKGYRQALKDVWEMPEGTIRWCLEDCDYKAHGNCCLPNDDFLKCPKIKKYIRRAKV